MTQLDLASWAATVLYAATVVALLVIGEVTWVAYVLLGSALMAHGIRIYLRAKEGEPS